MKRGWDGTEACCVELATVDRGGGGAPVNSKRGKSANVAHPKLGCPKWVVDQVCEVVAELWAWFGVLWWDVMRVRSWRAHGGTARRRRPRGEKRGNGNEENQTGIQIFASTTCTSDAVWPTRAWEQPRGARPLTTVGHNPALKFWMEVENGDWQRHFEAKLLLTQFELAKGDNHNFVELYVHNNVVNWILD
jgi:hypothetical protein